jgi:Ca-activated chloride channel family protein
MRAALSMMREDDTFNIIRFAGAADQFSPSSVPATPQNIRHAQKFIDTMEAGGGTMMLDGIRRSLNQSVDENRVRYVCMMTDGFIGNEKQIIHATRQMRGATRVFGFGVGSSPNRYLIDGMSRAGAGAVAYLSLNEKGEDIMRPFFERISRPALTEIEIDSAGLKGAQINPFKVPDVYVGRAVVVTGRFEGEGGSITVRGRSDGQVISKTFDIKPTTDGTAIASVWARQQIASLCDSAMFDDANIDLAKEIKSIALNYSLMSDYTSFVAVDSTRVTDGTSGVTVHQPVPVPDGVRYDTTVQGKDETTDERK